MTVEHRPRLNLLVLRSSDIERAARFWRALGLTLIHNNHGGGSEHYVALGDGFSIEIYLLTASAAPTAGTRLGFRVRALDTLLATLEDHGARIVAAPHESAGGRRAVVKDLDGHFVELVEERRRDDRAL